jgi:hypothetical protein
MNRSSFPRRQQYRRVRRAAASGSAGLAVGALAVFAAGAGAFALAGVPLLVTSGLVIDTHRWVRLAGRGAGAAAERSPSCASCAPEASSGSRTES